MSTFLIALTNVGMTLLYMVPGFALKKVGKVNEQHLPTLSGILIYLLSPCMLIYSFFNLEKNEQFYKNMALFFLITLVIQCIFIFVLYLVFKSKYDDPKYRMFTIASTFGNVGFFGLPIVKAILPNNPEVLCYSSITVVTMNLLVFTVGIFCITNDKKYMTPKAAVCNPTVCGFLIGFIIYIFELKTYIPSELLTAITLLGSMTTPVCMFIAGIRLATMNLKEVFTNKSAYLVCFGKLIVLPLFAYLCVAFFPLDAAFKSSILILMSVPCASVVLAFAEMYDGEKELSANCFLLSTILCFFTIPLLCLIL